MAETPITYSAAAVALLKANIGFFNSEIPEAMETYLLSLLGKAFFDFA